MNDKKSEPTVIKQMEWKTIDANLLTVGEVDTTGKLKQMKISSDNMKRALRGLL